MKLLAKLSAPDYPLAEDPEAAAALAEMGTLFDILGKMGNALDKIRQVIPSTQHLQLLNLLLRPTGVRDLLGRQL